MRGLIGLPSSLEKGEAKLLVLLGAAFFIGQYDMTLLSLALPDVQASFAIEEENLGRMIAVARLGAIPALFLALTADRIGRRRLLVLTLVGLSLASVASGLARSANQFMVFQSFTRLFTTLEEVLAVVYALEMLPARHRGWGVGFLAAMGGLGSGLASLLYGGVELMPGGWRALYLLGGLAILYVAWLRRGLPESALYEQQSGHRVGEVFWQPVREILTQHRHAALTLAVIATTFWFQIGAALNFMSKYLQSTHGYSPVQVSTLYILAGTVAIFGNVLAGRISDAIGRRPTLAAGMVVNCGALILFYNSGGLILQLAWIAALFSFFVVEVVVNAVSGELFPTSCRSTAASLRNIVSVIAAAAGLAVEGSLFVLLGSHAAAISLIALSSLLGLPAVLLWLRETAKTTLQ